MFGADTKAGQDGYVVSFSNNGTTTQSYLSYGNNTSSLNLTDTNKHRIDFNKNVLSRDDSVIQTFDANTFVTPGTMYLFAYNRVGKAMMETYAQIFSCKVYNDNNLVRDFVPCKNKY